MKRVPAWVSGHLVSSTLELLLLKKRKSQLLDMTCRSLNDQAQSDCHAISRESYKAATLSHFRCTEQPVPSSTPPPPGPSSPGWPGRMCGGSRALPPGETPLSCPPQHAFTWHQYLWSGWQMPCTAPGPRTQGNRRERRRTLRWWSFPCNKLERMLNLACQCLPPPKQQDSGDNDSLSSAASAPPSQTNI